jgi:hypothetical protein
MTLAGRAIPNRGRARLGGNRLPPDNPVTRADGTVVRALAHNWPANSDRALGDRVVPEEGVEPSRPSRVTGF